MSSDLEFDIVELLLHGNFLGLRNGDNVDRMRQILGEPEATSSSRREPVLYKYGNVQVTCIGARVVGVGIDLTSDASSPPENMNLSGVMKFKGLSRSDVEAYFAVRKLQLVDINSNSVGLSGGGLGFLSFEDGKIYRAGLLMHE